MSRPPPVPPPLPPLRQGRHSPWWRKLLMPVAAVLLLLLKLGAKLKFVLLPVLKFLPILLKTGGTMFLSIWLYATQMGWKFAVGFVLLIFVHECGHLIAARRLGLKVGLPVFIPFMGAFIALKEAPRNAWIEAQVGIGGPLLGAAGAAFCGVLYEVTNNPLFLGLAYTGCFLNLFNLAPVGFLDGGRIVTALSPWFWVVGIAVAVALLIQHPNLILFLVVITSLPRLFSLFRRKTDEERRYYEVTPGQRWFMGLLYFGLIILLVLGMHETHLRRPF